MKKRTVIGYHDNCMDGFVAGMIAHTKAIYDGMPNIQMIPVNYNEAPFRVYPNDDVILVDFCFHPQVIQTMREIGANVTIVDHHETQIQKLTDSQMGKYGDQAAPNISFTCDCRMAEAKHTFFSDLVTNKDTAGGEYRAFLCDNREVNLQQRESGASITWRLAERAKGFTEFAARFMNYGSRHPVAELRYLIELARIHDLYQHNGKLDHDATRFANWFKDFSSARREEHDFMKANPAKSFDVFSKMKADFIMVPMSKKLRIGEEITQRMLRVIRERCEQTREIKFIHQIGMAALPPGTRVGFIPGEFKDVSISMAGNVLVKEYGYDVAVMTAVSGDKITVLSMRSDQFGKNVNVGEFCKAMEAQGYAIKGGGHRNAAGCNIATEALKSFIDFNPVL